MTPTIPDEAVQAALDTWLDHEFDGTLNWPRMRNALTAALPFLQGVSGDKMREALYRLSNECKIAGLQDQAGFDCWLAMADEVLAETSGVDTIDTLSAPSPRAQALEEAAKWLDNWSEETMGQDVSPEYAAAAIRALSYQPVADDWLPIETAPKDGTEFLGHDASTKTTHVTFMNSNGYFHDPDSHYYSEAPEFKPTHWRPLPASPGASE